MVTLRSKKTTNKIAAVGKGKSTSKSAPSSSSSFFSRVRLPSWKSIAMGGLLLGGAGGAGYKGYTLWNQAGLRSLNRQVNNAYKSTQYWCARNQTAPGCVSHRQAYQFAKNRRNKAYNYYSAGFSGRNAAHHSAWPFLHPQGNTTKALENHLGVGQSIRRNYNKATAEHDFWQMQQQMLAKERATHKRKAKNVARTLNAPPRF